jgi:hypothetical protein
MIRDHFLFSLVGLLGLHSYPALGMSNLINMTGAFADTPIFIQN